ncbi:MAG: hypothetical protein R2834_03095 [Rhodothermales bacterium]
MRFRKLLLLLLCVQAGVASVFAQDTTLTATITHIAGDNAYINVGRADGVQPADTLQILAAGRMLGRMVVISTSSRQSILGFVSQSFPLTRGMKIDVTFTRSAQPGEGAPAEAPPPVAEATPQPVTRTIKKPTPPRRDSRRVRVDGRIMLSMSMLSSETQSLNTDLAPVSRQFATPSINVNATVRNLPSNARIQANVRSEYRSSSSSSLVPERSVRAYQLNLQKSLSFGEMQFGRFYNNFTPHGGYWDGGSFLLGSRKAGVGVTVGFMPERSNEGFTTDFPRISGFAQYRTPSGKPFTYRVAASYHEVHPTALYLDHKFGEFTQEFDWKKLSVDQDIQIDQDPLTQNMVVTLFQLDSRYKVTDQLQVRSRYYLRQPYRMYSTVSPISTRRDQIGVGFNLRRGEGSIGGEYSNRYTEGAYDSRSILMYANTPFIQPLNISISANASLWSSSFGEALYASAGLMRSFGSGNGRVEYAFYRTTTTNQDSAIDVHRVSFSTSLPLSKAFFWNARVSFQQSRYLSSVSGQTSLQIRF